MTLADVLAVISGLVIAGAGFACLSVLLSMLTPNALERAGLRATERPGRSAVIGLLAFLAVFVLFGGFMKAGGAGQIVAIVLLLVALCLAVLGGAGLAARLGRRYRGGEDGPFSLHDLLRGVFLLEGAVLLPIVGWLVVLPVAFLISLGASTHAVLRRRLPQTAVASPAAQS